MASSGSPRRVPPSVGARVLNLRFGMPRGSHGPPTAPAKRTTSVTDEQRATRAQVLHPAPPAGSLFSESTTTAHGWSVVTSQSRASVFRGSSRQKIWRPVADTEGEWPQSERSNAPRCETGTIFSPAGDGKEIDGSLGKKAQDGDSCRLFAAAFEAAAQPVLHSGAPRRTRTRT